MESKKIKYFLCIDLLNTFSEKEIKGLKAITACQYFNTDKYVIKLLETLKKRVLNKGGFTDEMQYDVYRKVFDDLPVPKNKLDKKQKVLLNNKMNVLLRLAERFLSIETMDENDIHKCELLYPKLLARKQYLLFNRHINKDRKQLDKQSSKGRKQYIQSYRMEENIFSYYHHVGSIAKENNLSDLIYNLDVSYLLDRLHLHAAALALKKVTQKKEYGFSSIGQITSLLNLPRYAEHPLVILYRSAIELTEAQDDEAYARLLVLLEKYSKVSSLDIQRNLYDIAINYCVSKMWTDRFDYTKKMFDLYNILHNKNLLLVDGDFILIGRLKNMIGAGCFVSAFEWAEEIIEYYRSYIREHVRESVCHFCYGAIAFHQKDYETAHDRFIQVDKINLSYDINTRVLIIKCLYEKEKEYNEYTMTAFRSAERFFKNNKELPQQRKKAYKNFIQILINLYRLRHNINATKADAERIKEKLEQQKVNSDKQWLLDKIEELQA